MSQRLCVHIDVMQIDLWLAQVIFLPVFCSTEMIPSYLKHRSYACSYSGKLGSDIAVRYRFVDRIINISMNKY